MGGSAADAAVYAGIDLAADPVRTGVALIREDHLRGQLTVVRAWRGAGDDELLSVITAATKAGVDVPFGWPGAFVAHVSAHATGSAPAPADSGPDWRRSLAMRRTDLAVRDRLGLVPLSVATDLIAYPALRWSALETRLRDGGVDCPRDGTGRVCEVYPAAALKVWGLPHRGYKKDANAAVRDLIITGLERRDLAVDFTGHREACLASDDVLDAVIAALVAREVARGRTRPPGAGERREAAVEGWIHVPEIN